MYDEVTQTWKIKKQQGTGARSVSENQIVHVSNGIEADNIRDREDWRQKYTYEDVLVIRDAQKRDAGLYSCQVSNFAGFVTTDVVLSLIENNDDKYIHIVTTSSSLDPGKSIESDDETESANLDWKTFLWIGIAVGSLFTILLLLWRKFGKRKNQPADVPRIKSQSRARLSTPNRYEVAIPLLHLDGSDKSQHGENLVGKMTNFQELDLLSDLFIDIDNILGEGNFGTVYKGRAKGRDVAIKRLKENSPSANINSLISELTVLCFIGPHENVVGFIGACTKEVCKGILYIVTELCSNGSLLDFLRMKIGVIVPQTNSYVKLHSSKFVSFNDLSRISLEIASGMEYIAAKKVVHTDLSARNVLLDARNVCKIGDFGFARKLYECQEYVKSSQDPLPWKWMAYESLKRMEFTTKSDVWSYGVTLWEIYSLGDAPFAGLHWTPNFAEVLLDGLRLSRPNHATDEVYTKMLECWNVDAEERPSFSVLITFFRNFGETR